MTYLNDFNEKICLSSPKYCVFCLVVKVNCYFTPLLADDTIMAANLDEKALETLRRKLYFTKLHSNGVCLVIDAQTSASGYISLGYRHPSDGRFTTTTVGRAAVMIQKGTVLIDTDKEASHLCHVKTCILPDHIAFEPHALNNERKICNHQGMCIGHGVGHRDCLIDLSVFKKYGSSIVV